MTKPLMEPGMLSALWARLVGGTPATGKVPTRQADGTVQWQTPSGGSIVFDDGDCDSDGFFLIDEGDA